MIRFTIIIPIFNETESIFKLLEEILHEFRKKVPEIIIIDDGSTDGFKEKVTPILKEGGYTMFSNDPFTDVNQLAQKFDFNCKPERG